MSTGVGSAISATKNKLWEATINGKTRRVVPFLNCIEKPVVQEPFSPEIPTIILWIQ